MGQYHGRRSSRSPSAKDNSTRASFSGLHQTPSTSQGPWRTRSCPARNVSQVVHILGSGSEQTSREEHQVGNVRLRKCAHLQTNSLCTLIGSIVCELLKSTFPARGARSVQRQLEESVHRRSSPRSGQRVERVHRRTVRKSLRNPFWWRNFVVFNNFVHGIVRRTIDYLDMTSGF